MNTEDMTPEEIDKRIAACFDHIRVHKMRSGENVAIGFDTAEKAIKELLKEVSDQQFEKGKQESKWIAFKEDSVSVIEELKDSSIDINVSYESLMNLFKRHDLL